jgi:Zn finger protein HypA/HybF involved in hydrogenase expression
MENQNTIIEICHSVEWYQPVLFCKQCGASFMTEEPEDAQYCPKCGRKIIGHKDGNETVFEDLN